MLLTVTPNRHTRVSFLSYSICGSSEWSSPGYGARPAWCDISTTSCCVSNIARTLSAYCTRNQKGNFRIGLLTERSRLRRALTRLQDQMRQMRHSSLQEQVNHLNQMLRGHYGYYGIAGNLRALQRVHRAVERYWRKMLSSRSWDGVIRWEEFQRIKEQFPLLRPKLYLPYRELQAIAIL